MSSLTSLLAFVEEKDNIYLLRSSPFRSKDIVLAKYTLSILEIGVTSIPLYLFLLFFFRVPGSFYLITLGAPMILIFAATGIMAGAYVPVFTNDPNNPPVPLAFSFPAINLVLGGCVLWIASEFANTTLLVVMLPLFTVFTVLLFLSLSVHALRSYK
jgi:ABC-type transport system involved in multi-copper enzyme maturation permease subunit